MDLNKLPHYMLVALGMTLPQTGCGPEKPMGDTSETESITICLSESYTWTDGPCLQPPNYTYDDSSDGTGDGDDDSGTTTGDGDDDTGTTTGDGDGDPGTGTDTATGSLEGARLRQRPAVSPRDAAAQRLLRQGALPDDVRAMLARRLGLAHDGGEPGGEGGNHG